MFFSAGTNSIELQVYQRGAICKIWHLENLHTALILSCEIACQFDVSRYNTFCIRRLFVSLSLYDVDEACIILALHILRTRSRIGWWCFWWYLIGGLFPHQFSNVLLGRGKNLRAHKARLSHQLAQIACSYLRLSAQLNLCLKRLCHSDSEDCHETMSSVLDVFDI